MCFPTAPERSTKECALENLIEKKCVEIKNQYGSKNLVSTLVNTHSLSEIKVIIMTTEERNANKVKLRYLKNRRERR